MEIRNGLRLSCFGLQRKISFSNSPFFIYCSSQLFPIQFLRLQRNEAIPIGYSYSRSFVKAKEPLRNTRIWSATKEEGATSVVDESSAAPTTTVDQTVSVSVSPSDVLTMFFQVERTINEAAIPNVTKALVEIEDITDLKVQVVEGIASVELTKQTTIQATGISSSLVETIQGSGFKLQTLNLTFQDEEDIS